jgi:hypothetical protein
MPDLIDSRMPVLLFAFSKTEQRGEYEYQSDSNIQHRHIIPTGLFLSSLCSDEGMIFAAS